MSDDSEKDEVLEVYLLNVPCPICQEDMTVKDIQAICDPDHENANVTGVSIQFECTMGNHNVTYWKNYELGKEVE